MTVSPAALVEAELKARDKDRWLACLYAPEAVRPGLMALFALDLELAQLVATTTEPMLGEIRLAWWRERLTELDAGRAPAQPLLQALLAHALPVVKGVELAGLPFLESFLVAAIDAALAAQNAVVAAECLGLSTVYIGALRNDVVRVAELLGLPPGAAPVFGLCIGKAVAGREGEVKPRLPQAAVLHRETYDAADAGHRAAYDPRMEAFSRRNEMAGSTWTQRVILRLRSFAALHGRDKLKEKLIALGFPLR